MTSTEPYAQLAGQRLTLYIGPVGESVPAVNATPAGNWVELGETDEEHSVEHGGALTYFYDNAHQGPVKATRPEEMVIYRFNLVNLDLENYARILDQVSDVASAAGPPATKTIPLKRGSVPNEYAMLCKGSVLSPYGAFPAMYVIPRGVMDGEPQPTFAKDGRAMLEVEFTAIEDDNQSAGDELGWLVAQTS